MNLHATWTMSLKHKLSALEQPITNLALLLLRVWVGLEFLVAGYTKLSGGLTPPDWFSGLDFPFPHAYLGSTVNWIVAGSFEMLFGSVLILGLCTRLAAACLLYVTYIAVYTVHFDFGWMGWNIIENDEGNGFKVPLMIAIMLFVLFAQGAGRWSLSTFLTRCKQIKSLHGFHI